MKFKKESLQTCSQATGLVVVIDVIRAFTTAAFTFAEGAKAIKLVSTVEEALFLRNQNPNTLVMGEVKGLPPDGFLVTRPLSY
jgi:2-phosphosulfolactate phosphatase